MSRDAGQIIMEDVHLRRDGREVLRGVSAGFPSGIVTAVVGPSGSGKTSLLRCLNRLEDPNSGRVTLDGADVRSIPPTQLRQRVGMIFQTPQLFEGGVRANLGYGLPEVPEDVAERALEAAGLPASFLERESSALSVGQAQRVCIARALVRDPDALLMDEPTSALDKDAAARIESTIAELAHQGLTIVLVTHNLAQARHVARRGILLNDGISVAEGDLDSIESAWPGEESS
jgi:ABC-type multidrug transport system fused ATPase/permease subunit